MYCLCKQFYIIIYFVFYYFFLTQSRTAKHNLNVIKNNFIIALFYQNVQYILDKIRYLLLYFNKLVNVMDKAHNYCSLII